MVQFLTSAQRNELVKLYIAYFNRAPEASGLAFHAEAVVDALNNGVSFEDAISIRANQFFQAAIDMPAVSGYSDAMTSEEFVSKMYENVLLRPGVGGNAPTEAEVAYWVNELNNGLSRGDLVTSFLSAVDDLITNGTEEEQAISQQVKAALDNRVTVGVEFAKPENSGDLSGAEAIRAGQNALAGVDATQDSVDAAIANIQAGSGEDYFLYDGIDTLTGTVGNDTFHADGGELSKLDTLDGGAGRDTLSIVEEDSVSYTTLPNGASISNIETIAIRAGGDVTFNASTLSGVEMLKSTQSAKSTLTAGENTDISVSGATDAITVNGGNDITITDATADKGITIGNTTAATGTITVTDTAQGSGAIAIDGGTDVTVTTTVATGTTTIGAANAASGAVSVAATAANTTDNVDSEMGAIAVTGGTTIDVSVSAAADASYASKFAKGATITQSDVTVIGDDSTTAVTVAQDKAAAPVLYAEASEGVQGTQVVTFTALAANASVTVDGLTFTAAKALTAAEVAQAFANLTAADLQSAGGETENGIFTGQLSAGFTSGAANDAVVTFTEVVAGTNATISASGATATDGVAGVSAQAGVDGALGVAQGKVLVADGGTDSLTTVTINGYADVSGVGSDALETLTLSNAVGSDINVETDQTDLTLNVDNITSTGLDNAVINLDSDDYSADNHGSETITDLTINATGSASDFQIEAAAVTDLTITAEVGLDIDASTLDSIDTVSVSGAGDVVLGDLSATVTDIDAAAATGAISVTVDGTKATVATGAGNDSITIDTMTVSKVVNTGAGDDKVTLAAGTTSLAAVISGGAGSDTLAMAAADAATASNAALFEANITGFEKLELGQVAADANNSVDLANMDDIGYVVSNGTEAGNYTYTVSASSIAAGDTVTITINGEQYTTTALLADATASDVAEALETAIGGDYTVAASSAELNFTGIYGLSDVSIATSGAATVSGAATTDVASGALGLDSMTSGGTLEFVANGAATVAVTDADTGSADVLNIIQNADGSLTNTVVADKVETINITATDIFVDGDADGVDDANAIHSLTVDADSVTSIVVTGDDLSLDTNSGVLTLVDASDLTGGLAYTADGAPAGTTVLGGAGVDVLTASGSGDVLNGGAGSDLLTGADLATLTGGEGNDTFQIGTVSNVNSYSTITDLSAGDIIDFGGNGTVVFHQAEISLQPTAVFQDYANEAVNSLGNDTNDAAWFQYEGNTYVVQSGADHSSVHDFQNGSDAIIQLVGLHDLSDASYNMTHGTLEIA